jgi:hypothetical protein
MPEDKIDEEVVTEEEAPAEDELGGLEGEEVAADQAAEGVGAGGQMINLTAEQVPELEGLAVGDPISVMMEATVSAVNDDGSFDIEPVSFTAEGAGEGLPAEGAELPPEEAELPPEGAEEGLGSALLTEPEEPVT